VSWFFALTRADPGPMVIGWRGHCRADAVFPVDDDRINVGQVGEHQLEPGSGQVRGSPEQNQGR